MLKLSPFEYHAPTTVDEAVALLKQHGAAAKLLAGGTDLIPSMKQKLFAPAHVIGLSRVAELQRIVYSPDDGLTLGAGVTWDTVQAHPEIVLRYRALAQAAAVVATPNLQNKGTVGGNVNLDTRCWYYNQSFFWRKSLGWCMKKDGDYCHVAPGLGKCVAVFSSDPVPAMIAFDATVKIAGPKGVRTIPLLSFYNDDGIRYSNLQPDELIVSVTLPTPPKGSRSVHIKFRKRESIDYPIANCAAHVIMDGNGAVKKAAIALGAIGCSPVRATEAEKLLIGNPLSESVIDAAAKAAYAVVKPMPNTAGTPMYRKKLVRVLVKRALTEAGK